MYASKAAQLTKRQMRTLPSAGTFSFIDPFSLHSCGIGRPRSNASVLILSQEFDNKYNVIVDKLLAWGIRLLYRTNWNALEDTDKSFHAEVMICLKA